MRLLPFAICVLAYIDGINMTFEGSGVPAGCRVETGFFAEIIPYFIGFQAIMTPRIVSGFLVGR